MRSLAHFLGSECCLFLFLSFFYFGRQFRYCIQPLHQLGNNHSTDAEFATTFANILSFYWALFNTSQPLNKTVAALIFKVANGSPCFFVFFLEKKETRLRIVWGFFWVRVLPTIKIELHSVVHKCLERNIETETCFFLSSHTHNFQVIYGLKTTFVISALNASFNYKETTLNYLCIIYFSTLDQRFF